MVGQDPDGGGTIVLQNVCPNIVGAFVGDFVGAFVGALVGAFVGDFVGAYQCQTTRLTHSEASTK